MKALVFDLDDTRLNSAKNIGPRTHRHQVIGHCDKDAIGPYLERWLP